jgi:hypothetical protein
MHTGGLTDVRMEVANLKGAPLACERAKVQISNYPVSF